ncbi:MAG: hypothetical protein QOH78_1176, partial [Verrucomicrobiota bacterium]
MNFGSIRSRPGCPPPTPQPSIYHGNLDLLNLPHRRNRLRWLNNLESVHQP